VSRNSNSGNWRSGIFTTALSSFWENPLDFPLPPSLPIEAASAGAPAALTFVGGAAIAFESNNTQSLDLTNLTGGIDNRPIIGDLIFVMIAWKGSTDANVPAPIGFTEIADLFASGGQDTNLGLYYLRATKDIRDIDWSENLVPNATRVSGVIHVWRHSDPTTPLDVTRTTATGTNGPPNAPSITTVTAGAVVLAFGATADFGTISDVTAPTGMDNFFGVTNRNQSDNLSTAGVASIARPTAGAYDPPTFTGGVGNPSWAAVSVAIRPIAIPGSGFTITADAASFALTGSIASLERGRRTIANAATYAVTGTAAALEYNKRLIAAPTSYTTSFADAFFNRGRKIIADTSAFVLAGSAATLLFNRRIIADSSSFSVSATAAALKLGKRFVTDGTSYSLSGSVADFRRGYRIIAETVSFSLSGTVAGLVYSGGAKKVIAETAVFTVAGTVASLEFNRRLVADAAAFSLSGTAATLSKGGTILSAAGTSYTLTGTAANFLRGRKVIAETVAFSLVGSAADFRRNRLIVADSTSFSLGATAATLIKGNAGILLAGTTYALNGTAANMRRGRKIVLSGNSYAVTGTAAFFRLTRRILGGTAQFYVRASDLTFKRNRRFSVLPTTFTISAPAASLYIRPPKSDDVSKLYKKAKGKQNFWRSVNARDMKDKRTLED
jgi:hypothetical protein